MRMLLPRLVATVLARRDISNLIPSDYCEPTCPSCRQNIINFNQSSSCVDDSSFLANCGGCQQCVIANSLQNGTAVPNLQAILDALTSQFAECGDTNVSSQVSALSSEASKFGTIGTAASLTATLAVGTDPTTAAAATATSTSNTYTRLSATATATSTSTSSPDIKPPVGPGPALNQTWVIGPVIGSILGMATVFIVIYMTRRKQRKEEWELGTTQSKDVIKDEDEESKVQDPNEAKAQLHSDCIPVGEVANTEVIPPAELPALEPVGMELLAPKDTKHVEEEWKLPVSPLAALFAMSEIRDARSDPEKVTRHETFYHP